MKEGPGEGEGGSAKNGVQALIQEVFDAGVRLCFVN